MTTPRVRASKEEPMMCLSALLLCALGSGGTPRESVQEPEAPPPVFASLSFDDAVASTKGNKKILVVKATAAWCQPCKLMDATTWRDEKVVAWFKEHGTAIQFDVDKQPDLAKKLEIGGMPTMIAFVGGQEFDRIVGYKDAAELLVWTEGVREGKRAIEAVRKRATEAPEGSEEEVDSRYDLAQSLAQSGELDKATEEFAWLWVNSKNVPSYGGVRGSFMAGEMERLARRHAPAQARFTEFRDEAGAKLAGEKVDPEDLDDWIVLNGVVGEPEKTLEWFDRVKGDQRWLPLIRRSSFRIEDLLEAKGRWSDIAGMHPDPVEELRRDHTMLQMSLKMSLPEELRERRTMFQDLERSRFRESAGKLHAVMLAAGREAEAQAVLDEAIKLDDSPEMRVGLVGRAVHVGQPRQIHLALLDQAEAAGSESTKLLRKRLSKALSSASAK